jgi:hypothetical protein
MDRDAIEERPSATTVKAVSRRKRGPVLLQLAKIGFAQPI